ncbi:MAG TPA: hypothetical protein VNU46_05830 [Gemmatimonadaceae bacterium]|nr:hypothetical protein [Gemmatimonadaceae bacterium]
MRLYLTSSSQSSIQSYQPAAIPTPRALPWLTMLAALFVVLLPFTRANAQIKEGYDDRTLPEENAPHTHLDTLQQLHMIHVAPHAIVFNATTRSATITLQNTSDKPIQGDILVMFAFPTWPRSHPADTTIITDHMDILEQRDSVVQAPTPKDHYIGPWLSGIPGRVTIPPHKTQQVTIKIAPPANLPTGEYWGRIVVSVNPQDQHRGNGQDTRQRYALPIKGVLPVLRDSVVVFYRQGPLQTGISFGAKTAAAFDSVGYGGPDGRDCPHSLWIRLPIHLTGNAHVDGTLHVSYRNTQTGDVIEVNKFPVSLYHDEVTHWWTHTCWVPVGTYRATIKFENAKRSDIPADQRLPMAPVTYTIPTPFTISH